MPSTAPCPGRHPHGSRKLSLLEQTTACLFNWASIHDNPPPPCLFFLSQGILKHCEGEEIFLGRFVYNKTGTTIQTFELQVMRAPGKDRVWGTLSLGWVCGLVNAKCCERIIMTKAWAKEGLDELYFVAPSPTWILMQIPGNTRVCSKPDSSLFATTFFFTMIIFSVLLLPIGLPWYYVISHWVKGMEMVVGRLERRKRE